MFIHIFVFLCGGSHGLLFLDVNSGPGRRGKCQCGSPEPPLPSQLGAPGEDSGDPGLNGI